MSEVIENQAPVTETSDAPAMNDELSLLKQRARLMGLRISNNIGLEALKAKISAALEAEKNTASQEEEPQEEESEEQEEEPSTKTAPVPMVAKPQKKKKTRNQIRVEQLREQMRLVRIRVTCLNPAKKDIPGEIFTVCNRYLGTVRKFVPFGDQTQNGYHIPFCIYTMMKERQFLHIRTQKNKYNTHQVQAQYVPEFAIEVLPQLTAKELKELAIQQAASAGKM